MYDVLTGKILYKRITSSDSCCRQQSSDSALFMYSTGLHRTQPSWNPLVGFWRELQLETSWGDINAYVGKEEKPGVIGILISSGILLFSCTIMG